MSNQTIEWLRGLAEKGGKGVVNNIDARCLGGIADDLTTLTAERAALDKSHADLARRLADAGRENAELRAALADAIERFESCGMIYSANQVRKSAGVNEQTAGTENG